MVVTFLKKLGKLFDVFTNTRAAGGYLLMVAVVIGVATFVENDYGTSAAQKYIYRSFWFELLLLLLGLSILVNVRRFRMIQQKKWALLTFHCAIIVILVGAGLTRYLGYEGIMHIRENGVADTFLSAETYLTFEVRDQQSTYRFDEPVLFAGLGGNDFSESYLIGEQLVQINCKRFVPNPERSLVDDPSGKPTVKIVMGGANGRQELFLSQGEQQIFGGLKFNFTTPLVGDAVNIIWENGSLQVQSPDELTQMVMATQERTVLPPRAQPYPLMVRTLYSLANRSFVIGDFQESGSVSLSSTDPKLRSESLAMVELEINVDGSSQTVQLTGRKGMSGRAKSASFDNLTVSCAYGAKPIQIPFEIGLVDFEMQRYPGTQNPASFLSKVQVTDRSQGEQFGYEIYMNHILPHGGYRFFQSSYDKDEKGTYLSVNFDRPGTLVSYLGYSLLALGLVLVFFSRNTRFSHLKRKVQTLRQSGAVAAIVCLGLLSSFPHTASANPVEPPHIPLDHADRFARVVVQDFRGRMKPMHTLNREVLRKIYRGESYNGLTADQVVLSMYANNRSWYAIPLIKVGRSEPLKDLLNVGGKYIAYKDAFAEDGTYKLQSEVQKAMETPKVDQGTYEKEVLKLDERINILNMIFSGRLFRVLPVPGDPNNAWTSHQHGRSTDDLQFFDNYPAALALGLTSNDFSRADDLLLQLTALQQQQAVDIYPAETKLEAEIMLNELRVFRKLAWAYWGIGLSSLILLFISVFKPRGWQKRVFQLVSIAAIIAFLFHTFGLGVRWYVSGRAPWSNGYESMIYVAWASTLAGMLFSRKSMGGLAASMILSGTLLLVAMLSFFDPEITPLVPVLRSYWLTIHVSLEAGSYGFLLLGAIIGLINLLLIALISKRNRERTKKIVQEMSCISEMTLIGGLAMMSIGTFLGGVWANESWGRYWGWDAKETWALVSILIYAFILHMRFIPKINGLLAFNIATLFGLSSIIMTYFGVNYYLSGLHSYAAGDPIPVPTWVFVAVIALLVVSLAAVLRKRQVFPGKWIV